MAKNRHSQLLHGHLDRLLTLQCLVRRFRRQHPEEFEKLAKLRDELAELLSGFGFQGECSLFEEALAPEMISWFTLLESREGREAVLAGKLERVSELVGHREFEEYDALIEAVADCLVKHLSFVETFIDRFNYCDYVNLLALPTFCAGEQLFSTYFINKSSPHPFLKNFRKSEEINFGLEDELELGMVLHPFGREFDLSFECTRLLSSDQQRFTSPSILLYEGKRNGENGGKKIRTLNLRIDLNRAPVEIDQALNYMRSSIRQLLTEEHQMLVNAPDYEEYHTTEFAGHKTALARIFLQKSQFHPAILGLWCWDLTELEGKSLAAALENIEGPPCSPRNIDLPGYEKMRKHLVRITGLVLSPAKQKDAVLDYAITQKKGIRLGLRESETLDS